jgi:hypothetical protein
LKDRKTAGAYRCKQALTNVLHTLSENTCCIPFCFAFITRPVDTILTHLPILFVQSNIYLGYIIQCISVKCERLSLKTALHRVAQRLYCISQKYKIFAGWEEELQNIKEASI